MQRKGAFILMVDDDEEDRMLLSDAFEELGYRDHIHFEENGVKALEYLRKCVEKDSIPTLIVLDLNMPKLNGRQTLKKIKDEDALRDVRVIIYSTSLNPLERDECLAVGAHAYIVKPVSYRESVQVANNFYHLSTK